MWNFNWTAGTCLIVVLWMTSFAESAEPVDYLRDVKPILSSRCYACHGVLKQESELRLDAGRMILKGGDSGPAVMTGKSAKSLLVERITGDDDSRMPPEGEPLTPAQIDLIKAWIDAGAKSPADEPLEANPREHWSFKTPVRPPVPDVKSRGWVRNPIDAFIAAEHEERGLVPRPSAEPTVLLRRVYLDLIGLPPSPEELRAFVSDSSTNAYETIVGRLLDSRHYGERWGRHWMDIWGYADAHGRSSQLHIWKWRDWIIESLNSDKGYDRMIIEMFAGDELAPGDPDVLRATGFLGRKWFTANPSRAWTGAVEHTGEALLALTFRCAACHDHKFDPVSQEEYYRFTAFFRPFNVRYDHVPGQPDVTKDAVARVYDKDLDAPTYLNVSGRGPDKDHPLTAAVPEALGKLNDKIEPITLSLYEYYPTLRPWVVEQTLTAAQAEVDAALVALDKSRAADTPNKANFVALAEKKHSAAAAEMESLKARAAADRAKYIGEGNTDELAPLAAKAEREAEVAKAEYEVLQNQQELNAARQALKANDTKTKQAVADAEKKVTAASKALDTARADFKKTDAAYTSFGLVYPKTSTGRRLALARWIASSDNPRTARVLVNHIWLRHFGSPLAPNVNDLGPRSKPPSHPELLDWLSLELVENGWSMKHLHRLIVTSNTYRMSSSVGRIANSSHKIDPENRFLWRMNHRRMEAEILRDNMLAAAGQLDTTIGGPEIAEELGQTSRRRSLYFRFTPDNRMKFLTLFDAADPNGCLRRTESIAPQQALAMTNGVVAQVQSRKLAHQLAPQLRLDGSSASESLFVTAAFEHVLSRTPTDAERQRCLRFLNEHAELLKDTQLLKEFPAGPKVDVPAATNPQQRARENLIHALFNRNDFITIR